MAELRTAVLIAATVSVGAMAGIFQLYAYAIMPGLARTDDRTFVAAFQRIDSAIINPLFMLNFLGALVLLAAAVALHLGEGEREVLPWAIAALVLYVATVVPTLAVNVPMNDRVKAAGDPAVIDVTATRREFNERRWAGWNIFRVLATTGALVCLAWALIEAPRP